MARLEEQAPTLEVINDEITDSLDRQGKSSSQVDTKAALIAGIAATAAQFLAGRKDPSPDFVFATAAYVCYAISFLTAIAAYAVARFYDVPEPRELVRECVGLTKAETLARLVATRVGAFDANRNRHRRKVMLWWVSVASLALGLALSTTALVQAPQATKAPQLVHIV
jgi:hypothetical protein